MKNAQLFWNECRLLWRSPIVLITILLTTLFAALGMQAVEASNDMQFHGMGKTAMTMSLGAAQYGALAGSALFAMLTLLVLSRDRRQKSTEIVEAAAGPWIVAGMRIAGLLTLGMVAAAACLLVTYGIHRLVTLSAYEFRPYIFSIGIILLGGIWIAILIAAALDLALGSLDASFLAFGAIYYIGLGSSNYLFRWVHSGVTVYSDFAGIEPVGRLAVYNRLFWMCVSAASLLAGWSLHRRAGASLAQSLFRNSAGGVVTAAMVLAAAGAVYLYQHEPYVFPSDSVFQRDLPRSGDAWLQTIDCRVELRPSDKCLVAETRYGFSKEQASMELEFITNAGMQIDGMTINGTTGDWVRVPNTDRVKIKLPPGSRADVEIRYHGRIRYPAPGSFPGYITDQSLYLLENSHWLFEPLTKPRGPMQVTGAIVAPDWLTVVTPGKSEPPQQQGTTQTIRFTASCTGLTLGLFAAEYKQQSFKVGQIDVEFYFSPRHKAYIQAAGIVNHIRAILTFYQENIGPNPFEGIPLKIVETSVYKPGGHASLNVVTIAEYLLNRAKVSNPDVDPRFILRDLKITAHELAHQWWGGGVTVIESGKWSSEGLAEFAAYKYLAARYPAGITDNISRGWRGSAANRQYAYYRRDSQVLERMRPALRQRLLEDEAKGQAYSALPLMLLVQEERFGPGKVRGRLAETYALYRGKTLDWNEFTSAMGDLMLPEDKLP